MFDHLDIVLGSQSPRRRQIFELAGFRFKVRVSEIEEIMDEKMDVISNTMDLASQKAQSLRRGLNEILVCADTLVSMNDGLILGKPRSRSEAFHMLKSLAGKSHFVTTGVSISFDQNEHLFYEQTKVHVANLEPEQINYYLDHHEIMDKAGSYGIQDWFGLTHVERIEGCYYNVMGFPMPKFYKELQKLKL